MLEPQDRKLLVDALRPPLADYRFDRAIGTCYSLDLMTALTVPLAFARFEFELEGSTVRADPIAWLDATRKHAKRISIFCQSGEIHVPTSHTPLYAHLEQSIVQVSPASNGVFHPKVWAVRYVSDDGPVRYRLLVLSRNLTFDRCWDTMLSLDGVVAERQQNIGSNRVLGEFLGSLSGLALQPLPPAVEENVEFMAAEIRRVEFEWPPGVRELTFYPLGCAIDRTPKWPFQTPATRTLVISPFVSSQVLSRLGQRGQNDVLISRQEELDRLSAAALQPFESVRVLNPVTEADETDEAAVAEDDSTARAEVPRATLAGLHAKVYVIEYGSEAYIYTGSANATNAAFESNVEFLVGMRMDRSKYGIESIIGDDTTQEGLGSLLVPYEPREDAGDGALALDPFEIPRRDIARARLHVDIVPSGSLSRVTIALGEGTVELPEGMTAEIRPLTLNASNCRPLPLRPGDLTVFEDLSLEALTTFYVVHLRTRVDGKPIERAFVLNLPVTGMPDARGDLILRLFLTDQKAFLRFLLLLLGDERAWPGVVVDGEGEHQHRLISVWQKGLFEALLRGLAREPQRIDEIKDLVSDLCSREQTRDILPDGFLELWEPVWQARLQLLSPEERAKREAELTIATESTPIDHATTAADKASVLAAIDRLATERTEPTGDETTEATPPTTVEAMRPVGATSEPIAAAGVPVATTIALANPTSISVIPQGDHPLEAGYVDALPSPSHDLAATMATVEDQEPDDRRDDAAAPTMLDLYKDSDLED